MATDATAIQWCGHCPELPMHVVYSPKLETVQLWSVLPAPSEKQAEGFRGGACLVTLPIAIRQPCTKLRKFPNRYQQREQTHIHQSHVRVQLQLVTLGCLQVPASDRDQEILNAAKSIMFSSAQKLQLTELSGRRDMSLLLAQSAVQVCPPPTPHNPAPPGFNASCMHCTP